MSENNRRPYSSNRFSKELDEIYERREAEAARKKRQAANRGSTRRTASGNKSSARKRTGSSGSYSRQRTRSRASYNRQRTGSGSAYNRQRASAGRRQAAYRRKRRRKNTRGIMYTVTAVLVLILVLAGVLKIHQIYRNHMADLEKEAIRQELLDQADLLARGYDYDGAIAKAKEIEGYKNDTEAREAVAGWKEAKKDLVEFKAEDVTHIFYHTLVRNTKLAFECDPGIAEGFKKWMTTIDEFKKITQKMYDDGYVLCSLYDFFDEVYDEDGVPHFTAKSVFLPEGKKPFVLSLDDLSYYHTYTGHGMASKLVLDEYGKVTCEYELEDGTVERGSYDCVPLLNDFMEEHPDGAYHGARGTIALTGYNGIFGYRTDESYVTRKNLDADKVEWLDAHPDFDRNVEIDGASKIAKELKAEGWDFASHTWGHIRVGNAALEKIKIDTEKWKKNVEPIIGNTECIIFAHGQDLSPTDEYNTKENKKYRYLASQGFHIFLNVDSHQKTMTVHDLYVHGGRRNLDGYRLWNDAHGNSDWTSDLFDASEMLDPRRKDMPDQKE